MLVRRFSATTLIGLALGGSGTSATLQRLDPGTLRPSGHSLRLPDAMLGYAWARQGATLALVVKPVATGQPVRIVDTRTWRVRRVIGVGDRDVCGLTFDGATLVALAADQPCYWPRGHFSILRIAVDRGRVTRVTQVPGLSTVFPTNLAFGDGHAYVARAGGGIDSLNLSTGVVVSHIPRRTLAKGEGVVWTHWLGQHLLAAGVRVVDVRTWRSRTLLNGARVVSAVGSYLVASGPHGGAVYTRGGRFVRHVLGDEDVAETWASGNLLYAQVGSATDVVDVRTGKTLRVVPNNGPLILLVR
jgi:hypothetical protein